MRLAALAALLVAVAAPAVAQVRPVPVVPASEREALRGVEVFLVNEGEAPVAADPPRQIEVTAADGTRLVLERVPMAPATVPPGGFVKTRYVPVGLAGVAVPPHAQHPPGTLAGGESGETVVASATGASAGFLDRFTPHEPTYGAFGLDDSGAKLQVSFAFQPFAEDAPLKLGNLRFAWTQTMFWAIDEPSGPFRATNYSPEVFAVLPVSDSVQAAIGYRHDSNGRDAGSLDINRVYARLTKSFDLGDGWRADLVPQAWFYVGARGAIDPAAYWGHSSLTAAISQKDGLKIAVTGRGSFETGRGSAEIFASYPLAPLGGGLGIYLFSQGFVGYGEALDDFTVRDEHARIGIAITR